MAVSIGDIIGTIKLEDTFSPKLELAARNVEAFAGKIDKIGSRISNAGKTLTAGLTLPLAALVGTSVKAAATFESSFAGVRKTVDATEAQFASLSKEIRALAAGPNAVPIDVNQLNKVAEAAGQLGIARQNIVAFTRTMADLGETTNLTADEAATAVAQFQNIFGAAGKEVDRLGSTIVALGNAGASTEKQIIEMGLRIAGAGTQIGLSQGEVLAFASTLSSLGIDAEAGGSAISKIMIEIALSVSKGGRELQNFAAISGTTAEKFAASFKDDAASAVEQFILGLGRLRTSGGDVLGTLDAIGITEVRMRDALLRASGAGDLLTNSLTLQDKAWRDNTALTKEAQERYKTFESQLRLTKNQINDAAITLGTALLPAIRDLITTIQPLIDDIARFAEWFSQLPEPVRATALAVTALAAAAGPVLFAIGGIAQGVASLSSAFAVVIPVISSAVAVLTGPAGWIAAGIALLVAWKPTRDFIVDLATTIFDLYIGAVKGAVEIAVAWWDSIEDIRGPIAELAELVSDFAGGALTNYLAIIKTVISNLTSWARETADAIKFTFNFARAIREDLFRAIGAVVGVVKTVIGWYIQYSTWVSKLISQVADSIVVFLNWSGILPTVRAAVNIVISGLSILWTWLVKAKDKLLEWIEMAGGMAPVLAILNPGLGASLALFDRWVDRAKELSENNKNVAATQDEINKKVEQGAKLIPLPHPKPPKPPKPPDPPVILTEDQEKALKSINDRIAAMARERDAQVALLAALRESPEAYRAEQREQEISNELFEARQELLQSHLSLTPALEAKIRSLTGSIFDTAQAAEKYNQALSNVAASIASLGSITIPKLDTGGDQDAVKQWAGALTDLGFELNNLRANLQRLPKDSAEYKTALAVLTETEKRYQAQISRLPEIMADRRTARTSEIRSILAVAESVTHSIDEEITQLGRGSAAWDSYVKSLDVKARAIQILGVFNLPKPDASDKAALAEWQALFDQWKARLAELSAKISIRIDADAAADLRRSLEPARAEFERFAADVSRYVDEGLLSEKQAHKILLRANELTGAMRDSMLAAAADINTALADGVVEAAFEGKEAWNDLGKSLESILKRLIGDWLAEWFRAMAQWLARWIATQAAARAASAAMGTGGGGGGGGAGANIPGLATGTYSAYSGGTASASQFAGAAAGWAVAAFALYVVYKGFVEKHTAEWAEVNLKTGARSGDTAKVKATVQKRIDELRQQLKDISEALELDLQELGDVSLGKRGKSYYVQIGESIHEGFATVEEAMDYARVAAIKFGTLGDQISDNVRQAINKSHAKTMEGFQADIDLAKKIDNLKMGGEVAAQMAEIFKLRTEEIRHAQDLGLSIKELIEARKQEFDSIRNSVLGIDDSVAKHLKDLFSYQRGAEEAHSKLRNTFERILGTTIEEAEKFVKQYGDTLSGFTFIPGSSSSRPGKGDPGESVGGGGQWLDAAGNAVDDTTRAILGKVDRFKKALERYYEQLAALPEKLTQDQMRLGVFNQLFGFIENNARLAAKYEGERAKFAKLQVDIQFKLIKLWMEAFGVFEEFAELYNDAYQAALQTAGRPSGNRGGGGGPDRKEIRADLLQQIAEVEAELKGPLHVSFLQFAKSLADFREQAKEGKLSAEDLAKGIAALTAQFQKNVRDQANALAGIGTDFTRKLENIKNFFNELRDLGRGKTGMPKWLVDLLEGKALAGLGKELDQAIAAFNGLTDPMAAITVQAGVLKENVLAFAKAAGWSAKQIENAMAAIDRGVEFQRQQGINSALDRLFAWAKQAGILAKESLEHERMKALLDITVIEAQFRFYGALTGQIQGWIDGIRNWINSAAFGAGNNDDVQDVRIVGSTTADAVEKLVDKIKSMVDAWRQAVEQFRDATTDMMTDESLTNLTQEEQLAFAKAQVEDLAARAQAGDADALSKLAAARAEFIRELRESEGAGFGFDQGWDWVMGLTADVLQNAQSAEQALIARELADNVGAWSYVMSQLADQLEAAFYANTQDLIDAIYRAIAGVPGFAQGGIVMRGPRLVRVAEQVAEAIVPLDRLANAIPYNRLGMAEMTMRHSTDNRTAVGSGNGIGDNRTASVYDQSERFRNFQRQNDSTARLMKIEESNRAIAASMVRMQQDMNAMRRKM
jgi:TP901 family phage tail tape measure protein